MKKIFIIHLFVKTKLMIIEEKILEKYPELTDYQLIFLKDGIFKRW